MNKYRNIPIIFFSALITFFVNSFFLHFLPFQDVGYANCGYFLAALFSMRIYLVTSLIVILLLLFIAYRCDFSVFEYVLVGLIIGGGLSNFNERLETGCVADHFDFFGLFRFNPADVSITVGVLTILIKSAIKTIMPEDA